MKHLQDTGLVGSVPCLMRFCLKRLAAFHVEGSVLNREFGKRGLWWDAGLSKMRLSCPGRLALKGALWGLRGPMSYQNHSSLVGG